MSRAWPSVRHVINTCSVDTRCPPGSSPAGDAVGREESSLAYCVLSKRPLVLTTPFSATTYREPAPKPEIPWAAGFPFVRPLTTASEKSLGKAST